MTPSGMKSGIQQANNLVNSQATYIDQIKNILYNKLAKNATVGVVSTSITSAANNISFSNVPSMPTLLFMIPTNSSTFNLSTTGYIVNVIYDGTTRQSIHMKSSGNWEASTSDVTVSWTNGTLKLTSSANRFYNTSYNLIYIIQPDSYAKDKIETSTATVSSNSRTISFSGLSGDVSTFAVIPLTTAAVNSSASYIYNIIYASNAFRTIYTSYSWNSYKINSTTSYMSKSYNNGTLTLTSTSPYFRSGIEYKLVAVVAG